MAWQQEEDECKWNYELDFFWFVSVTNATTRTEEQCVRIKICQEVSVKHRADFT